MTLTEFLKSLGPAERKAFAAKCGTTAGHMRNCAYALKESKPEGPFLSPAVCMDVERESRRKVLRETLRPHDWMRIWPSLVKRAAHTESMEVA